MSRRYIHATTISDSSGMNDTVELRGLVEHAAVVGMTAQAMEDELATRTGFEDAVRKWVQEKRTPNGMVRKIILNSAKAIVSAVEAESEAAKDFRA